MPSIEVGSRVKYSIPKLHIVNGRGVNKIETYEGVVVDIDQTRMCLVALEGFEGHEGAVKRNGRIHYLTPELNGWFVPDSDLQLVFYDDGGMWV